MQNDMGAEFNVNQALDQAKNFIKERLDKKSVKQATSIDGIIEEFFKDTSYDFNVFYQKLIKGRRTLVTSVMS